MQMAAEKRQGRTVKEQPLEVKLEKRRTACGRRRAFLLVGTALSLSLNLLSPAFAARFIDLTGNWTATSSNHSWLNVYPSSGNGPSYFALVSAANYTGADRTATVTIVGSGYTQTIQVTQPTAFYSLSTTSLSVPASGGTQSFAITANTQWSAYTTAGGDWFSLGSNSYWGPGSGTISFTVARNTSGRVKVATITVQSPNLPTRYVTVTQAAR